MDSSNMQERGERRGPPQSTEASLPELKLTQAVKSAEPVVGLPQGMEFSSNRAVIQPHREYTLVFGSNQDQIKVLDNQGNNVEGQTNTDTEILNWEVQKKRGGRGLNYEGIVIDIDKIDISYRFKSKPVSEFPERLQQAVKNFIEARSRLKNKNWMEFPDEAWSMKNANVSETKRATGDGFVLFSDNRNANWIAFQTKNDQGIELPPRNWRRYDLVDEWAGRAPNNIQQEVRNFRRDRDLDVGAIKKMESGYYVTSLSDRLVVTKPGQKFEEAEFTDRVAGIGNNVCEDPKSPGMVYYCQTGNLKTMLRLDTTKEPIGTWQTEAVEILQEYKDIRNLKFDPSGNFFMFDSGNDFVILSKDTLQEVKRIPKFYNATLDDQGRIRGIDAQGHLVIYDANFKEVAQEAEKRRVARLAQGLAADLFRKEGEAEPAKVDTEQFQHLLPAKADFEVQFSTQLQSVDKLEDISDVAQALDRLKGRLAGEGLQPAQVEFITEEIASSINNRERVLAEPVITEGITNLDTKLSTGNLTLAAVAEAKVDLSKLKSLEGLADENTRRQIHSLETKLTEQSAELFRREGAVISKEVNDLTAGVRNELEQMTSMPDFSDWQEFRLPQLAARLGVLASDCPLEASDTQRAILAARRQIQDLSREKETIFKERYAEVREKASEVLGERVDLLKTDLDSFMNRLRGRGFKDRSQAETYIRSSESLGFLRTEIEELSRQNPDISHEMDRYLKVQIANIMSEIERGGLTTIAETGQQMELFGKTLFPKWEAKVKERVKRQVDVIFIPDEKTKGPGVTPDKILGDIGIAEINSRGSLEKRRLYEGIKNEDEWRYGSVAYRGQYAFPSYVTAADYRLIKQDYADWSTGDKSSIRKAHDEKRQALHEWYKKRQPVGKREREADEEWKAKYKDLLSDFAEFSAGKHISLFNRIDSVKNAPETDVANGAGYVPEWASHWTTDEQTERYLEDMAKALKMQIDLQEGLLDLKGHAGSGKDVLIKMFANRTNRPYFSIDCSKWTTEFELSEDVMLESKEGASQTVKVPSVVLNAIITPGAVMYFNEISAMPEQAQIFLHGLTDEKRTLTLKTSSGKAIKADKSVLLVSSRNPGYPGTFDPQFATKSRMVGLQVDYPPLLGEKDPNDRNPNVTYSASEALRTARSVDSLADFTYEANPEHNEFVKIWDREVNGIENDAPELNQTQKFDLEVILALTQFANKLREGFMLKFEKARASQIPRGTLLVDQPITGREMRRSAYTLSKMPADEKATANPEAVARELLDKFFLTHIDSREERNDIRTAMATWTSSKRPAA